jgi:hypothetical protein
VLPNDLQTADVCDQLQNEYEWTLRKLTDLGLR